MASVERLRVGIVGTGRISDLHAAEYVANPATEIAAVCDIDADAALARARSWGAAPERAYADWRELLADPSLDAFEILLPHHMHLEVGLAALATGKHVSMQKPVAFTRRRCDPVRGRPPLARAHADRSCASSRTSCSTRRSHASSSWCAAARSGTCCRCARRACRAIRAGAGACRPPPRPGASTSDRCGGGPLVFDDGLHKFSIFWALLGMADEVHAWIGSTPVEGGALDAPSLVGLRWATGAIGSLEVVNAPELQIATRHYVQDDRVEVSGTKGVAWVNRGHGRLLEEPPLRVYRDGRATDHVDLETGWEVSFILATRDFIDAVRDGRPSLLSPGEHRDILSTALAAQVSAREGRAVRPDEVRLTQGPGPSTRARARQSPGTDAPGISRSRHRPRSVPARRRRVP